MCYNFSFVWGNGGCVIISADFTPVCTTELASMATYTGEFEKRGVKLLGISCDDVSSHKEWIKDIEAYKVRLQAFNNSCYYFLFTYLSLHLSRAKLGVLCVVIHSSYSKILVCSSNLSTIVCFSAGQLIYYSLISLCVCVLQPGSRVSFPIAADPKKEVIKQLNMVDPDEKDKNGQQLPSRALHLVGPDKKVHYLKQLHLF
jgi:peroxiredoxin